MKLPIALALAAFAAPLVLLAGNPSGLSHPGPSHNLPNTHDPVDRSPGGNKNTPYQPKSGAYVRPTPVPIERKISVLADLEITIQPGDSDYRLHILSSLPIRNLKATNRDTGQELAAVRLDDAVDFTVRVDGQPNTATALILDVNMGLFKGKQRIRQAIFDLMETAEQTGAKTKADPEQGKAKAVEGDEPMAIDPKDAPAPASE